LLASPDAASSPWVQAEVDEWLKLKSGSLDMFCDEGRIHSHAKCLVVGKSPLHPDQGSSAKVLQSLRQQ